MNEWVRASRHGGPWTEGDFEAVPPEVPWVELHDGALILGPGRTLRHQRRTRHLADAFERAGAQVACSVDLRMAEGRRFRMPDVTVTRSPVRGRPIASEDVLLVAEICDEQGGDEWGTRLTAYAEAGIPRYLIHDPMGLHALVLRDGDYHLEHKAAPGEPLRLDQPIAVTLRIT